MNTPEETVAEIVAIVKRLQELADSLVQVEEFVPKHQERCERCGSSRRDAFGLNCTPWAYSDWHLEHSGLNP